MTPKDPTHNLLSVTPFISIRLSDHILQESDSSQRDLYDHIRV
jgi:hypothetical protein